MNRGRNYDPNIMPGHDLRQVEVYLRQIESDNADAAMARAMREIQHDNYRLQRLLDEIAATYVRSELRSNVAFHYDISWKGEPID